MCHTGVGVVLPPVANVTVAAYQSPRLPARVLDRVTLNSTLTLTALNPLGVPGGGTTLSFLIDFLETPNSGSNGVCADGSSTGAPQNSAGCGDIFVIDKGSLNFPFFYNTGDGVNQQYFISFVEVTSGLNPLSQAACLSATGSLTPASAL